jgi:hypothetical protein
MRQDEAPGTPNAGQTVYSAFDVSDPLKPSFIAQVPLGGGALALPSRCAAQQEEEHQPWFMCASVPRADGVMTA